MDRRIAGLAVPALGALIAEPLFLIVDSAMIGHLGAAPLAGLAIASAILQTAVGLMVFLAYSTTPIVARRAGGGDRRGAVQAGIDGLWLALAIGAVLGVALWVASGPLVSAFGAAADTTAQAVTYLAISSAGLPAMLLVFAASGLLRGLQDTKTPLAVATIGFTANALLNWLFIYGLGFGVAGAATGTVIAQWGMVAAYLMVIGRHTRAAGADLLPHRDGLRYAGRSGWWLFIRTAGLRGAFLATVAAAAAYGTAATAGYQVVFTIFSTTAFALDALAIAAQALVGEALGARDAERTRFIVRRVLFWGLSFGVVLGVVVAAGSPFIGRVFTTDEPVLAILPTALIVLGVSLPLAGYVFVLDGVLMGAGDARYLAWTSLVNLAIYLPALWLIVTLVPTGTSALVGLTAGFTLVFMAARALTLGLRTHRGRWIVLGPVR
ncbi:MATE family efflux transporter [Leucobacter tardus]|uniref:MATE family efflux transporter n=1 Tax=Leucobacter tardus TaxID=501483 RepID=A0A939TLY1_9MICO|nr:MATE family efflux transporter [Leucobacter tardus]MBO2988888.1 MATE family efflux transporter [Leucobacter tardus]